MSDDRTGPRQVIADEIIRLVHERWVGMKHQTYRERIEACRFVVEAQLNKMGDATNAESARLVREAKSWHEAYVHAEAQVGENLQRALKAEELAAKRDAVLDEVNKRLAVLEPKIDTLTKRVTTAERERDNARRSIKAQNTVIAGLCRAFDDKMAGVFDVEALMARLGELVKKGTTT